MNSYVCKIWYALTLCTLLTTMPIIPMGEGGGENEPEQPSTVSWGDDNGGGDGDNGGDSGNDDETLKELEAAKLAEQKSAGSSTGNKTPGENTPGPSEPTTPTSGTSLALTLAKQALQKALAPQQENATTFTNATGDAKTNAAYLLLDIVEQTPSADQIKNAYEKEVAAIKALRDTGIGKDKAVITQANQILETLEQAKDFLLSNLDFDIIKRSDIITNLDTTPGSASSTTKHLDPSIEDTLNNKIKSQLTDQQILEINKLYQDILVTDFQKQTFIKNLNELTNITEKEINKAAKEAKAARPEEPKLLTRVWNGAVRFWKQTFGSEADYVSTIVDQALDNDQDGKNALKNKLLTKDQATKNFRNLDTKQKITLLSTIQKTANEIAKSITTQTEAEVAAETENPDLVNPARIKREQQFFKFQEATNEIINSFKPMLSPGQKIFVIWDRASFEVNIKLVDFNYFRFNPRESFEENTNQLMKIEKINPPKSINKTALIDTSFEEEKEQLQQAMLDYSAPRVVSDLIANAFRQNPSALAEINKPVGQNDFGSLITSITKGMDGWNPEMRKYITPETIAQGFKNAPGMIGEGGADVQIPPLSENAKANAKPFTQALLEALQKTSPSAKPATTTSGS